MLRMWGKLIKDNRMINEVVISNDDASLSRTNKVFNALDEICYEFDLGKPIWLDKTIKDFKLHSKTRFHADNFIESIEFDYLEIQVIEED